MRLFRTWEVQGKFGSEVLWRWEAMAADTSPVVLEGVNHEEPVQEAEDLGDASSLHHTVILGWSNKLVWVILLDKILQLTSQTSKFLDQPTLVSHRFYHIRLPLDLRLPNMVKCHLEAKHEQNGAQDVLSHACWTPFFWTLRQPRSNQD